MRQAATADGDRQTLAALDNNGQQGAGALPREQVDKLQELYQDLFRDRAADLPAIRVVLEKLMRVAEEQTIRATLETLATERFDYQSPLRSLEDWLADLAPLEEHSDMAATEPLRKWVVPGWLPAGRVTRLSSHGGSGKTYLAMELATAVTSVCEPQDGGLEDWGFRADTGCGVPVLARTSRTYGFVEKAGDRAASGEGLFRLAEAARPQPVVFVSWEDEPGEFRRRFQSLPSGRVKHMEDRVKLINAEGHGALWAPAAGGHRDKDCVLTRFGARIEARIRELQPSLVVIDPVAAAFQGNENDRGAVRKWLSHLNALARETTAAILLISHPPKHGQHQYSGSTDWDNGVRAAWTLDPEIVPGMSCPPVDGKQLAPRGLALTLTKSNYSRVGQRIWLRWELAGNKRGLERCTAAESCRAWHRDRNLPQPVEESDKDEEGLDPPF